MEEVRCGMCHGTGSCTCPRCEGAGRIEASMPIAAIQGITRDCPKCHGSGGVECPRCEGTGYVVR